MIGSDQSELLEIISLGRRTVGLHKIDRADLERMRQEQYGGAKTEEQERLLAVQEYLRCELKIDSDIIKSMEIERIFPPPVGEPSHLYVTFRHESAVAKIFERTRLMRSGSRILYYVPRQFKYRAKAIREIEYQLRHAEKFQTRIKMGLTDLELWKKVRGINNKWEKVSLPKTLPPVDLNISAENVEYSFSPPPGRPGQINRAEKRDRDSTGSNSELNNRKLSRNDEFHIALEKANLVSASAAISPVKDGQGLQKKPDNGMVLSVSGTPLKQHNNQDLSSSPIISSKPIKK